MNAGILDTSVLIREGRHGLADRDGAFAISVMTIAELHMGAAMARSTRIRSLRIARLALIEQSYEALPIDRRISIKYGEIAAATRRLSSRPHVVDGLIAATAIVHGLPLLTADDDFDRIPGVEVVKI